MTYKEKFEFLKEYVNSELITFEILADAYKREKRTVPQYLKGGTKQLEDLQNIILGLENENTTK